VDFMKYFGVPLWRSWSSLPPAVRNASKASSFLFVIFPPKG